MSYGHDIGLETLDRIDASLVRYNDVSVRSSHIQ